jgi:F5/8 type C domain.
MKKIIVAILTVVLLATSVSAAGIARVWSDNEHPDYLAEYAGDGDTEKFWHTDWENGITEPPFVINFELDGLYSVTNLGFLPRQDTNLNGLMYIFNIYASEDGNDYTLVKEVSDFVNTMDMQNVAFDTAVIAKFLRFEILETEGLTFASLNELEVTGEIYVPVVETAPEPVAEPEPAAEVAAEPVAEAAPAVITAPQTSDASVIFVAAMAMAVIVFTAVSKKRLAK